MDKYHFTDHQLLGQGGFSDVYHAVNQHDGLRYAIKTFRLPSKDEDRQRVMRYYQHEAQALSSLDHPNIVRCLDHYVQANGSPIIIMPQIEGDNLRQYIDTQGIVPTPIATQIALQVAHALEACHHPNAAAQAKGLPPIVHNDLHPRNIICTPSAEPHTAPHCTLIDFGLSFAIGTPLTLWEKEQGVKEYKAPEKWTRDTLTPATDVYSFGVLLFALFTGRPPFVCSDYNDTAQEEHLRQQCLTAAPPSLWTLRAAAYEDTYCYAPTSPDLPYWWQRIAERCLSKDPAHRYATATELLADIAQGEAGLLPTEWPEQTPPMAAPSPAPTQPMASATPVPAAAQQSTQPATPRTQTSAPPTPTPPAPTRKRNGCAIFMVVMLIVLTAIMGLAIAGYWVELRDEERQTQYVRDYYKADVKTLSANDLSNLTHFFGFPLRYYNESYDTELDFRAFYLRQMRQIKQKVLRIDTIDRLADSSDDKQTVLRVRGSIDYIMRDGTTKTNAVDDRIVIDNATQRIVSVTLY